MASCTRRGFVGGLGAAAAGALIGGRAGAQAAPRPNIVFILADDWGWGDLSCYGHPQLKTPNLDRLAGGGTRFTQFYTPGSVCSPTRAGLLTGRFPARLGIHGHFATPQLNAARAMPNWLDPQIPTVTGLLKQAGYRTGHFGKWHLGSGAGAPSVGDYGIDVHRTNVSTGPDLADKYARHESSKLIVDHSLSFIESAAGQPFYVNVWLNDTHAILDPSEEQFQGTERWTTAELKGKYKTPFEIYYAAAQDADRQIGRLLDRLRELNLAANTIVVFAADNGPEEMLIGNARHSGVGSPGPFRGRKRSLYEGGIRVPCIVRWPGHVPAGAVDDQAILGGVDWLPTICALAGAQVPGDLPLDGESVADLWQGARRARRRPLLWEWRFRIMGHPLNISPNLAIRDGQWKLLLNHDRSRTELYDLPADPMEVDNVARDHPDVVERLAGPLLAWAKTLPTGPFDPGAGSNTYRWPTPAGTP